MLFVVLLSCEESLEVNGPQTVDADKTVSVILSNVPSGFSGSPVYLFTLNNKGQVHDMQQSSATEGAIVNIVPLAGNASYDIVALIPTEEEWSSKTPFKTGYYSRVTGVNVKEGVFVTTSWEMASELAAVTTTGIAGSIEAQLLINGSATPADTEFSQGEIVTLNASVTDNINSPTANVTYSLDNTQLESYTVSPYSYQLNTLELSEGYHTIYLMAANEQGHESQDSLRIYITEESASGPSVSIANLSNGQEIERQTVLVVEAYASDPDDGVERVEFRLNNGLVATDFEAPYEFVWDTYNDEVGTVTLEVTAFDNAGEERTDVINVELYAPDNYAPRAIFTAPNNGASFALNSLISLSANATDVEDDPIAFVRFYYRHTEAAFDTYIGQAATSPYSVDFDTSGLPAGTYYVFARAYDENGYSSYDSITITIE